MISLGKRAFLCGVAVVNMLTASLLIANPVRASSSLELCNLGSVLLEFVTTETPDAGWTAIEPGSCVYTPFGGHYAFIATDYRAGFRMKFGPSDEPDSGSKRKVRPIKWESAIAICAPGRMPSTVRLKRSAGSCAAGEIAVESSFSVISSINNVRQTLNFHFSPPSIQNFLDFVDDDIGVIWREIDLRTRQIRAAGQDRMVSQSCSNYAQQNFQGTPRFVRRNAELECLTSVRICDALLYRRLYQSCLRCETISCRNTMVAHPNCRMVGPPSNRRRVDCPEGFLTLR